MPKAYATVINWGEIEGSTDTTHLNSNDEEIMLTRPESSCLNDGIDRRGDDTKLIQELRDLNEDEHDEFGEYGWELIGIAHLPKTTIVEWRSDRGHHATTQICWML
jgi:hypothetical protein